MTIEQLSRDEIALYDRQIRLWGMGTQLRLKSAKILLINLGAVGMETVKNLVLGGINSIELMDDSVIKSEDFGAQFFLPNDDSKIGQLKVPNVIESIKELNNRVEINVNTDTFTDVIETDEEYFKKFDLIIATEVTKSQILSINRVSRHFNIPLYVSGVHGMFGYIITDLVDHFSESEKDKGNQARQTGTKLNLRKEITAVQPEAGDKETLTVHDTYHPLETIFVSKLLPQQLNRRQLKRLSPSLPLILALFDMERSLDVSRDELRRRGVETTESLGVSSDIITEEYLTFFTSQAFTEFAPTAAILGGALAQDIIQFLGRRESPVNNVLVLDGMRSEMPIYTL